MNNIHEMRKKRGEIWDRGESLLTEHQDENGMLSAEDTSQYEAHGAGSGRSRPRHRARGARRPAWSAR